MPTFKDRPETAGDSWCTIGLEIGWVIFAKAGRERVVLAEKMARKAEIEIDLTFPSPRGQKYVTPHVLKHTAITWALQRGATIWDAAGYFSTSAETIQRVYGHHSPDHQASAVAAMKRK